MTTTPTPTRSPNEPANENRARDWVAIILAVAIGTALNAITFAVLYYAIFSEGPGLSENATQVLTGWGGGIIGILGAYAGYKVGASTNGNSKGRNSEPVDQ